MLKESYTKQTGNCLENNHYITLNELQDRCKKYGHKLFIWGFSIKNFFLETLEYFLGDWIEAYLDNNTIRWGQRINGHEILKPDIICGYASPIVIINEYYKEELSAQLSEMGIDSYYIVTDCWHAYRWKDMMADSGMLKELVDIKVQSDSSKALFKVFDGFGDTILKLPLLEYLASLPEADDFYFIVTKKANYDIYIKLFRNVCYLDRESFIDDRSYRIEKLRWVNEQCFRYSVCFCTTESIHDYCDFFNEYNTNITKNYMLADYLRGGRRIYQI